MSLPWLAAGAQLCLCTHVYARLGIRELRASVAAAVRRAGAGERLIVTVDGRPVAQLGPLDAVTGQVTLEDLIARGLVTAPRRTDPLFATDPVPVWSGARVDRLLREIRG